MSPADPTKPALERQKLAAEIRNLGVEHDRLVEKVAQEKIQTVCMADNQRSADADPSWTRIFTFYGSVSPQTVYVCMREVGQWSRRDPGQPITLVFNSPGGSLIDGFALYDFLIELRSQGHRLTTVALGMAASMGGVLLQAGEHRVMGRSAFLLIHEASSASVGKVSELDDDLRFIKRLQDRCAEILAERSTLAKAVIKRRWDRRDWWLSAEDALEHGFIDEIRDATALGQ